jgi:hypothetical protein
LLPAAFAEAKARKAAVENIPRVVDLSVADDKDRRGKRSMKSE